MILTVTMNPAIDKIYFLDEFKMNNVHRPQNMIASAGGKGLNVARVAKLIGEEVAVTGFLGGGSGQYLRRKIEELGLDDRFVGIDNESRTCVNIVDNKNGTTTEVLEHGPTISQKQSEKFISSFKDMISDVDVITLCGSLPKGLKIDFYAKLIDICKKQGKKVLLDTSGDAFRRGALALPYMVKPNEDEIKTVYDGDVESIDGIVESIKFFMANGIEFPVVSLGKDGSLAGFGEKIYKVSFPPISIVNTVGSGDSFIAGFAAGLSRGLKAEQVLKLATACGSANTQYAQTGFVELEMVNKYIEKVIIEKI